VCVIEVVLIPLNAAALDAELSGDARALANCLDVVVDEWPPNGGEWDRDAMRFFRRLIDDPAFDPRFGPHYVISDGALVGSAGFFGLPDEHLEVEIGYSVCERDRRRGVATATIAELCARAAAFNCATVRARVRCDNIGSLKSLVRNGFVEASRATSDHGYDSVVFRRSLTRPRSVPDPIARPT
jgi:RimJ/RimL family protein N-acetyltransferase